MTMTPKIKINNKKPTENNSDSTNFRAGRTGVRATGAGKCTSMTSLLQVGSRARAKEKAAKQKSAPSFAFEMKLNKTIPQLSAAQNGTTVQRKKGQQNRMLRLIYC